MSKKFSILIVFFVLILAMLACATPPAFSGQATPDTDKTIVAAAAATVAAKPTDIPATQTSIPATATAAATATETPVPATATVASTATNTPMPCNRAQFVSDVSYPDNTEVAAGNSFTKTWRLQNTGSCIWTADYRLVFVSGYSMSAPAETILTTGQVAPGQTVDASVALVAPQDAGTYKGAFMLRAPDGATFGIGAGAVEAFWVQVVVVAPSAPEEPEPTPTKKIIFTVPTKPVIVPVPTKPIVIIPKPKP